MDEQNSVQEVQSCRDRLNCRQETASNGKAKEIPANIGELAAEHQQSTRGPNKDVLIDSRRASSPEYVDALQELTTDNMGKTEEKGESRKVSE